MKKKFSNCFNTLFPSKSINIFLIFLILLGIISGSIFSLVINSSDKKLVIEQFNLFIDNINKNNINNLIMLKNNLNENIILFSVLFLFGMSLIAVIVNTLIIYFKSFSIGFILSSMFNIYKIKGFLSGFIYLFTSGLISLICLFVLGVYSIFFSINLFKFILLKEKEINIKLFLKRYIVIFLLIVLLIVLNSLLEAYLLPSLTKLFINIFI